jgi:maltooligosyltrehalose trehalohydrolase
VTAQGRLEEFARHGWDPSTVPDPQDPATFDASKLDWSERESERGARMLATYRRLVELRRRHPELTDPSFASTTCSVEADGRGFAMRRGDLLVLVNFGDRDWTREIGEADLLFETESGVDLAGGSITLPAHAGALLQA